VARLWWRSQTHSHFLLGPNQLWRSRQQQIAAFYSVHLTIVTYIITLWRKYIILIWQPFDRCFDLSTPVSSSSHLYPHSWTPAPQGWAQLDTHSLCCPPPLPLWRPIWTWATTSAAFLLTTWSLMTCLLLSCFMLSSSLTRMGVLGMPEGERGSKDKD